MPEPDVSELAVPESALPGPTALEPGVPEPGVPEPGVPVQAMPEGTWLAFDFGLRRIGVAHGNSVMKQAHPLCVIDKQDNDSKFAAIATLLKEWQPVACIVGLPLHPDGAEHDMTRRARRFGNQLHGRLGVAVRFVDERYSSAVLNGKRGQIIDAEAAAIILQQFFDEPAA